MKTKAELELRRQELDIQILPFANQTTISDEDDAKVRELLTERDSVSRELKLISLREAAAAGHAENANDGLTGTFNVNTRTMGDPWKNEAAPIRDRARAAAELVRVPDIGDENATRQALVKVIEGAHSSEAGERYVLESTSNEYVGAFSKLVARGSLDTATDAERQAYGRVESLRAALNEGSVAAGQALVPAHLSPAVIITNAGQVSPIRQISHVETINTQTWTGVTSAGITAEWTAEAAEVADASPSFGQPTITPVRADAYVQASFEVVADAIGLTNEIVRLLVDARDRLESTAFAVGTGVGQPEGVITGVAGVTNSRIAGSSGAANAADFVLADVYALADSLSSRWQNNASWVGSPKVLNKVRRFGEGVTSNAAFWADLGQSQPSQLLGHSVYQASDMDSTIVSGSTDNALLFGDFRAGYYIIDRLAASIATTPWVVGANRRPTGEHGFLYVWRVGAKTLVPDAFRLLVL